MNYCMQGNDTSFDNQSASKNMGDTIMSSFVSLLSSAQTLGLQEPIHPMSEPLLGKLLSSQVHFDVNNPFGNNACSFPSLSLNNKAAKGCDATRDMSAKEAAAFNLAFPICVDRSDVETAPVTILNNIQTSFKSLLESRLLSAKKALFGNLLKQGTSGELKTLMKLLSGGSQDSSPISLTTIVTSFRAQSGNSSGFLPITFETVIDTTVLGTLSSVTICALGTISGSLNCVDGLLEKVEILFDTTSLLNSMMKEARLVVKKTIARAAGIAYKMMSKNNLQDALPPSIKTLSIPTNLKKLSPPPKEEKAMTNVDADTYQLFANWLQGDDSGILKDDCGVQQTVTSSANFADKCQSINLMEPASNEAQPKPSLSLSRQENSNKQQKHPYELFSWLAGDNMLLKDDDVYMRSSEKSSLKQTISGNAINLLQKRKRVSFSNQNHFSL